MVAACIRVAQGVDLDPAGGAVVVINTASDPFVAERTLAIRDALKLAGITAVEEVRFEGEPKIGEKLLKERVLAKPKTVLLFALDSSAFGAVRDLIAADIDDRTFIAACYVSEDQLANVTRIATFAAIADFTPMRLIRKAVSTAVALTQGRAVTHPLEFRINVTESPVTAGALKAHILNAKNTKAQAEKEKAQEAKEKEQQKEKK